MSAISVTTQAEVVSVIDDLGREVRLEQPAKRIISLAPSITENLFSAGMGDLIVGTVDHSDYPKAALSIPRIGNYTSLNTEAILASNPDLVVAWQSGNPAASVERLIKLGLTVFYAEPKSFEQVLSNIERLALLGGKAEKSKAHVQSLRQQYQQLTDRNKAKPVVSVFYQVWNEPLITLNGGHFVSRAIERCRGSNIFADEPTTAPRVNVESIISKNPQSIIMGGHQEDRTSWKNRWLEWPAIDAVANGQVAFVNPDLVSRPTERLLEGTQGICDLLDAVRRKAAH